MKLIIAGGRDLHFTWGFIDSLWGDVFLEFEEFNEIVSGGCSGVDNAGEHWAKQHPDELKLTIFPADWDKYGKSAGPKRNKQMAEYADALLLIWDGSSRGSRNMKTEMMKLGKPIYEVILKKS